MLGAHTPTNQKRKILAIVVAVGVVILVAVLVWQTGAQKPVKRSYTPVSVTQTTAGSESATTVPTQSTSTTILAPKISKSAGSGGIVALSPTSSPVGIPTTTAPTSVGLPTTTDTTSGTTTPVDYGAQVDPRFVQSPTNPLKVSYGYSASASIIENGQFVPTAVLPAGQLEIFSEVGQVCSLPVGGTVTSGTCSTTCASFGTHSVVANYVTSYSDEW